MRLEDGYVVIESWEEDPDEAITFAQTEEAFWETFGKKTYLLKLPGIQPRSYDEDQLRQSLGGHPDWLQTQLDTMKELGLNVDFDWGYRQLVLHLPEGIPIKAIVGAFAEMRHHDYQFSQQDGDDYYFYLD